jgi:HAD superfamily hydrolase (TIGR01509 family)
MLEALLWDVDGTLAETERDGHLLAFNHAFESLDLPWRWSDAHYAALLAIAGGRERLLYDLRRQPLAPRQPEQQAALAERIHQLKTARYAAIVGRGALPLRAGVAELFEDCAQAGLAMAIVTTTTGSNVDALLAAHLGPHWRAHFAAVVCAEDAPQKKPDPQAYLRALALLGVPAAGALAIEDSPAGVSAARAAGVAVVVARSAYFAAAALTGALAVGPSLGSAADWQPAAAGPPHARIDLPQLARWHATR